MEEWMVNVVIAVLGVVATYAVLRSRVDRLEVDFKDFKKSSEDYHKSHTEIDEKHHKEINLRVDAGFKKQDDVINRITVLERDTSSHLDMQRAEDRFVSHKEFKLYLENINASIANIAKDVHSANSNSTKVMGKLEDLYDLLASNIPK